MFVLTQQICYFSGESEGNMSKSFNSSNNGSDGSDSGRFTRTFRTKGLVASISAAILLATSVFTGSNAFAAEKINLVMWQQWGGGHEEDNLKALIANYVKTHPNVSIKEVPVSNNAKILAAITGGNAPDIVDLGSSLPLGGWAAVGALVPLDDMIKKSGLNTNLYIHSALTAMQEGGKTYGLPFQAFNAGLLYNKHMLAAAGLKPPTSMEELFADAKILTKKNSSGQIIQMGFLPAYPGPDQGQTCPLISYGYAFGASWFDAKGNPTPATPQAIAALKWEKSFYDTFGVKNIQNFVQSAGSYLTAGDPLESGKVAMMFDGPWSVQYALANNPKVASQLVAMPLPASRTSPASVGSTYIDANAQVIPSGTKHVQAAFDFIKWETTNGAETAKFSNAVANIPQLKSVPSFDLLKRPYYATYVKIANGAGAKSWIQTKSSTTYGTNLCAAQDASLLTGVSPAKALAGVRIQ